MGDKEQKFLLDNSFNDICLNRATVDYHGDKRGYIYVSDVMETYVREVSRQQVESPATDNHQLKAEIHRLANKWRSSNMTTAQLVIELDRLSGELSAV